MEALRELRSDTAPRIVDSSMNKSDAVILSAVRTGFGTFGGTLKHLSATELGAIAATESLRRAAIDPALIDHAIFGNALQTSADAIYLARHVALAAGTPIATPALTVNRLCGSGFEAVIQAARLVNTGEAKTVLCGGTESMSQAPHALRGARWGLKFGQSPPLEDTLSEALRDSRCNLPMAETAERLAAQFGLTREQIDLYALRSQQAAKAAWDAGYFADEVIPVAIHDRKARQDVAWAMDEHIRADASMAALTKLSPAFRADGVVTAGNASGINDGAGALVVASEAFANAQGLTPLARIVGYGVAGVPPEIMGIGPVPAIRAALAHAGLTLAQMDRVEVNEAFAAQYLAVEKELGLDRTRTNVEGGAIAIGHPLAASGARITAHLVHTLRRIGGRYGVGSACIGGGQGIAIVLESLGN